MLISLTGYKYSVHFIFSQKILCIVAHAKPFDAACVEVIYINDAPMLGEIDQSIYEENMFVDGAWLVLLNDVFTHPLI